MKKFAYFTAIAASAICHIGATELGTKTNNLEMAISIKGNESTVSPGQDFILIIRYRNAATNQTFTMYNFNQTTLDSFGGVGVTVISPSGKDVSPHYNPGGGSGALVHIGPSETKQDELKLSDFIKLTEPGAYTITARKTYMSSHQKTREAVSNPLTVSVVPPGATNSKPKM